MPMTLKRYVNGQVVPIKLSLLDALRWDPEPRKRKGVKPTHPAAASIAPTSASKATITSPTPMPTTVNVPNQKSGPTNETKATTNAVTKEGEDEAHTFTAADDAKLIEMKAAGVFWRDIQAEMKKSHTALKERFKEINPNDNSGVDAAKKAGVAADEDGEKKKKKDGEEVKAADEKKGDNQEKQAGDVGKKNKKGAKGESDQKSKPATSAGQESTTTTNKSSNAKTDPNQPTPAQIAAKYDKDKWRFAASKHFDLTGERISVEEVKRRVLAGH